MPLLPISIALLLTSPAHAYDLLDYWSYDDYSDGESMVGVDGWERGFDEDDWEGYYSDYSGSNYVQSTTDYNTGDFGGDWGSGGAIDNWLVNSEVSVEDGVMRVVMYTEDDDTVGVVCRFGNAENYILAILGPRGASNPIGTDNEFASIVKIAGGSAEVLATEEWSYTAGSVSGLELSCEDDQITLSYWQEQDDRWASPDEMVTATDSGARRSGSTGFYAYDAGGLRESGETRVLFGAIEVLKMDEDEDGVADDDDNCEEDANSDQADADSDGIGDVCDDSSGGEGGGGEGGGEGGTDSGGGSGGEGGTDSGGGNGGGEGGTDTGGGNGGEGGGNGGEGGTDSVETGGTDSGGGDGGTDKMAEGRLTTCSCASADSPSQLAGLLALLGFVGLRRRARG